MPIDRDPGSQLLRLLARGRVRLSAAGDAFLSAQKTAKGDGSVGVRLVPLEAPKAAEHFQAIIHPSLGRFQLLSSDESKPEHTSERHSTLFDLRLEHLPGAEEPAKAWLLGMARALLAEARLARPADLQGERFLIADRDAALAWIAALPTTKRKGKPVVEVDAEPLMGMAQVVNGSKLHALQTMGGRIVRHRGRLVVSHVAFAHPTLDVVGFLPLAMALDLLPSVFEFAERIRQAGAGIPPLPRADEVVSELRPRVALLADLPEQLCRRGLLQRSSLRVSRTKRQEPGIAVPADAAEEVLREVEAEMEADTSLSASPPMSDPPVAAPLASPP